MNVNLDYVIINKKYLLICEAYRMNTMQLACFLAVAETLNFARAAEQLHVTQPAVTQQIHSLETELQAKLFRRTTRMVELTQAGLVFLSDAKAILEISERAKKQAGCADTDIREPFIIGCHAHNDIIQLAQPLKLLKARFPHLYPVFQIVPFQHLYQRLLEEAVDVVVAFREGGLRKSIRYSELTSIHAAAIVEAEHPLAQAGSIHLRDLRQDAVICLNPQKCPEDYKKLLQPVLADRSPQDVYFCDSAEAAAVLAQAGYGIAVVPDFPANRSARLNYVSVSDAKPMSYGVYYKSLANHPQRRTFVELAKKWFAAQDAVDL